MESIKDSYYRYLRYFLSKDDPSATDYDRYMSLAYAVRSEMVDNWIKTQNFYHTNNGRRIYYLSMEYVFGKSLHMNIINNNLIDAVAETAKDVGFSLEGLYNCEDDLDLGNGGKGRLAASFQEAMATLRLPAMGYGIRYDYAQFKQSIEQGAQKEKPYDWLHKGHPWEIVRPEYTCIVKYNGESHPIGNDDPRAPHKWDDPDIVVAVPSDLPIAGYHSPTVNTLRLWSARAAEEFLSDYSNHGDYNRACEELTSSGRISKVLFPDGDVIRATEMRIKQQYFLIATSLHDIVRRYKVYNDDISKFDTKVAIHLNGSRCALAIPELMRILVDEELLEWDTAWKITKNVFSYTSHAVSRDNLEVWPVYLIEQALPRHMQIINNLNHLHLEPLRQQLGANIRDIQELSIIEEGEVKRVKMGHLAILGASNINGVSKIQTSLLERVIFPKVFENKSRTLHNVTNGVSHRRWLHSENNLLADLITDSIGDSWITDSRELIALNELKEDNSFLEKLEEIKAINKQRLLISFRKKLNFEFDSDALFDVQCKKIHPYKRQVLHVLHIVSRYLRLKNGEAVPQKRLHIFGGKAMPSDFLAKQIISLIHVVADVINRDPDMADKMKIVFIPNYGLTWAGKTVPAADLSEEIATPGLEACATTNFKMAINGAILIASKCGANVEMIEALGQANIFSFGHECDADFSGYCPYDFLEKNPHLHAVFTFLEEILTSTTGGETIFPLISSIRDADKFKILPDFQEYLAQQNAIDALYQDRRAWNQMCLNGIAKIGIFSSDRAVREYAEKIWKVRAVTI